MGKGKKNINTNRDVFQSAKDRSLQSKKQQWAKAISNKFAECLRKHNPNSPLKKSYMYTHHCNNVKIFNGETMQSSYCKNRWCYTCNRIRTAINIHKYGEPIFKMGQPFFVTLTLPTCELSELKNRIADMENCWRKIYKYSKDKRREPFKNGINLYGIRKMECTLRPDGKYHYHFHLIVEGWANAEFLRSEWLKRNPDANPNAQDVRPVTDKGAILEVLKYTTKMSVKMNNDTDFERLDKLFITMKGKRTLSTFGGLKAIKNDLNDDDDFDIASQIDEVLKMRLGNEESVWVWDKSVFDWINVDTGECLIDEELPKKIQEIVKH